MISPENDDPNSEFLMQLRRDGVVSSGDVRMVALTGGVSSEIYRVEDGGKEFVVKRALKKLKVAADWYADVSRNDSEFEYIKYVSGFAPDSVPRVLKKGDGYFSMEFLDGRFQNWKTLLLAGDCQDEHGRLAGAFLASVHAKSRGDVAVERAFSNEKNFWELRIEPYIIATAEENPILRSKLEAEAERLRNVRECLIHGDYSPKNLLVGEGRLVALDCEVATYGDPVFDYCFLMTHLHLKALLHAPADKGFKRLVDCFTESYFAKAGLGDGGRRRFSELGGRLLPILLLARVDGKSPVEYLKNEDAKNFVRAFCYWALEGDGRDIESVSESWFKFLNKVP